MHVWGAHACGHPAAGHVNLRLLPALLIWSATAAAAALLPPLLLLPLLPPPFTCAAAATPPPPPQVEDLVQEVAAGPSACRAMWKWACLQVAQRAARTGEAGGLCAWMAVGQPCVCCRRAWNDAHACVRVHACAMHAVHARAGARYEAALYGALCGSLPAVLPVCGSWEDACWAHCRAWLDTATDDALGQEPGPGPGVGVGGAVGLVRVCEACVPECACLCGARGWGGAQGAGLRAAQG